MKKCTHCGVTEEETRITFSTIEDRYLCMKHYQQVRLYGGIFKTKHDGNDIEIFENHAEVITRNTKHEEVAKIIIDLADVDLVEQYTGRTITHGYAQAMLKMKMERNGQ